MNKRNSTFLLIIFVATTTMLTPESFSLGRDNMKGPAKPISENQAEIYGSGDNLFLDFYQKWFSPVRGGNTCPMYPACSQYAKIAFRALPWYEAYTVSLERLLRCGNELDLYPITFIYGERHWYDPVITEEIGRETEIDEDN